MEKKAGFDLTDELCINTIRFLSIDGVEAAQSGHPGMPMGDAPMAYVLWKRFLRHNPNNPKWAGRDRFVLSAGHGSMLLYSLLHLTGYPLSLDELKNFRQWGSLTPGHPEHDPSIGVEMTTGPLGQGFATGVGMAMAQRYLAERYNRPGYPLFDYNIYAITSDGDLMEGVSNEAASLAGHLGLGNIVYLYSDNRITIEGSTDIAFSEDVGKRFEAMGWHVQKAGGNDLEGLSGAIEAAIDEKERPSIIIARTNIGFGSPAKQDSAEAHGAPLGAEEVKKTRQSLGWPEDSSFHIPAEAHERFMESAIEGAQREEGWSALLSGYRREHPELAAEIDGLLDGRKPMAWVDSLPSFIEKDGPMATRQASGKVLNAIAPASPFLIGGSADLAPSNNTHLKGMGDFLPGSVGRNLHFGVREHAMGSILNGMALSGMIVPYGATFLIFSDYMRPPMRLAALMGLHTVYVFTHDSIGLGEDGPTHQPIEQLAGLRAVPRLTVIRPADATETTEAWKAALQSDGPVALVLTRQGLPVLDRTKYPSAALLSRGAYTLVEGGQTPDVILMATGSEVHLALAAAASLEEKGITARVVSMPSWELFEAQEQSYRDSVLPPDVRARISIEAASPAGWHRWVGLDGDVIGIDRFGASAPYKTIFEKFGFTAENVTSRAMALVQRKNSPLS